MEIGRKDKRLAENPIGQGGSFRLAGLGPIVLDIGLFETIREVAIQIHTIGITTTDIIRQRFAAALLEWKEKKKTSFSDKSFSLISWTVVMG